MGSTSDGIRLPRNVRDMGHWGTAVINFGPYAGEVYWQVYKHQALYCMKVRAMENIRSPSLGDFQHYVLARDQEAQDQQARDRSTWRRGATL
jgi:hypothetical protein